MFNQLLPRYAQRFAQQYLNPMAQRVTAYPALAARRQPFVAAPATTMGMMGMSNTNNDLNFSPYAADSQQKTIMAQLLSKYGQDSPEVKEFVLTTADLSPMDEIRMLSPCGADYTNSIFHQILYLRFNLNNAEEPSRYFSRQYERCLVRQSSDELEFWDKVREMSQVHAGFVQGIKDQRDNQLANEERNKRQKEITEIQKEADELKEVAVKGDAYL